MLSTCGTGADYTISSTGACGNSHENSEDYVFSFTPATDVCVDIDVTFQTTNRSVSTALRWWSVNAKQDAPAASQLDLLGVCHPGRLQASFLQKAVDDRSV